MHGDFLEVDGYGLGLEQASASETWECINTHLSRIIGNKDTQPQLISVEPNLMRRLIQSLLCGMMFYCNNFTSKVSARCQLQHTTQNCLHFNHIFFAIIALAINCLLKITTLLFTLQHCQFQDSLVHNGIWKMSVLDLYKTHPILMLTLALP